MADFKINGVTFASETGGVVNLSNANVFPTGHIVQIEQFFKNNAASTSNNQHSQWVHLGMLKAITTANATNDILIHFSCSMSSLSGSHNFATKITRTIEATEVDVGVSTTGHSGYNATTSGTRTSDTNTYQIHTAMIMDSPGFQGVVTYKLYHFMQNSSPGIGYLNRTQNGPGSDDRSTGGTSSITLMEIQR